MSQHPSLRSSDKGKQHRSVLKRYEKLRILKEKEKWKDEDSVFGLAKVKVIKFKIKKEKAAVAEGEEAAAAAPGAVTATPAAGTASTPKAAGAAKGAASAKTAGAASTTKAAGAKEAASLKAVPKKEAK